MSNLGGFPDMRPGHGGSEHSFWPSFTDIMMVVVMIFLLGLVAMLVRNTELARRLIDATEAERAAESQVELTETQRDALRDQLRSITNALADARYELQKKESELIALRTRADADRAELTSRLGTLTARFDESQSKITELDTLIFERDQKLERITNDQANTIERLRSLLKRSEAVALDSDPDSVDPESLVDAIEARLSSLQSTNEALEERVESSVERVSALEGEFSDLKVEYDKLVRPARSPSGKRVAEVRYFQRNGESVINYRGPEDSAARRVTREELDDLLGNLQAEGRDSLYVKVVIPDDSGLSFNEAWVFTNEMLESYDYYYQGQ